MRKKIILFFPSTTTGGVEFLLKTAATILSESHDVLILDIENGWFKKNVTNVSVETLVKGKLKELDGSVILITFGTIVRYLDYYFCGDFKVISWGMHPNNLIPALPRFPSYNLIRYNKYFELILKYTLLKSEYEKLYSLVCYLKNTNSLYTMDEYCSYTLNKYLGLSYEYFLPVAITNDKALANYDKNSKSAVEFSCVWLGRLDGEFKNKILKKVLLDLDRCSFEKNNKILFSVIGNGKGFNEIAEMANELNNIEVIMLGELMGEELKQTLAKASLGFAMGTAAIEIAACRVPTVLLDFAYKEVPKNYRYRWFYESTGYTLGRLIDNNIDPSLGNKLSMHDVVNEVINNYASHAEKSYDYYEKNHSLKSLEDKLFFAIESTTSSFKEMKTAGLLKKPFWENFKKLIKVTKGAGL